MNGKAILVKTSIEESMKLTCDSKQKKLSLPSAPVLEKENNNGRAK